MQLRDDADAGPALPVDGNQGLDANLVILGPPRSRPD